MRLLILAAALTLTLSPVAQAFDCAVIDTTTTKAYEKARNEQRKEVARAPADGGAFEQPKQSKDATCTSEMQALMSMGGFSTGAAVMDVALKKAAERAITRQCDKLTKQVSEGRARLNKAIKTVY